MKLPARERFAAVLLFSHDANEVDSELLVQTREYLEMLDNSDTDSEDEVDAFNRIVLDAMVACKPIEYMHIAGLNNLVHAIWQVAIPRNKTRPVDYLQIYKNG